MIPRHLKLPILLPLLLHLCAASTLQPASSSSSSSSNTTGPCFSADAAALLQLKRSFLDANLTSWQAGSDCCRWEAVTCDEASASRRVVALNLEGRNLLSRGLHPAVFNLTSLRYLSLANNDFMGASLPPDGFELLSEMVHLDLRRAGFVGQIPIGIARLSKLVALDLSSNHYDISRTSLFLYLKEPTFQNFIANLSSLRKLQLDDVNIYNNGETWSMAIANSTPKLQILSLSGCGLSGSIHHSFSRLGSLVHLNLRVNGISGQVPDYFAGFPLLSTLELSQNDFEGQFPSKILQLKNLRTLLVSFNPKLSGNLPSFPVQNRLEQLILHKTSFSDAMPASIVNLKRLQYLSLTTQGTSKQLSLIGRLPSLEALYLGGLSGLQKPQFSWIGNLKHLKALSIEKYNFNSEPIPSWFSNLTDLEYLGLTDCNFGGSIPQWIRNMTQLSEIDFSSNYLTGKIPGYLFNLPEIQILELSSNQLSGHLEDIENPLSSSLCCVYLSDNKIDGSIPQSYLQTTSLQDLHFDSNKLTGTLDLSSFWRLNNLESLILSNNMLSVVHEDINCLSTSLPKIDRLELASCNLRKLPGTLRCLHEISFLDLSRNRIHGVIPSWLWGDWKGQMVYLNLSHNMFTSLETLRTIIPREYSYTLDLSYNRVEGKVQVIPTVKKVNELMESTVGTALDYSNNYFSSIPPYFGKNLGDVIYLDLSKNKLNGHIPASLCSSSRLQTLDLSYNHLSGLIPSCLTQQSLRILKLRGNKIHGVPPDNIREGCMLETIDLNNNHIAGKLPRSLSNCRELALLDVGNNQMTDSFPSWLGVLPKLQVLVLRSNQFFGMITDLQENDQINYFSSLHILDLASNSFMGHLPQGWFNQLKSMMANDNDEAQVVGHETNFSRGFYQDTVTITYKGLDIIFTKILTTFKVIDISNNSFDGPILESVGRLVALHGLNISYNNFTGQVPSQLGNLIHLESLDLSHNRLSGKIPQELTALTSLAWLNLSYNNLTGTIPQGNQFLSFPNSSFEGNPGLCGSQVMRQCDNPGSSTPKTSDYQESNYLWHDRLDTILLFTFTGLGFGVGFAFAIILQILSGRWMEVELQAFMHSYVITLCNIYNSSLIFYQLEKSSEGLPSNIYSCTHLI